MLLVWILFARFCFNFFISINLITFGGPQILDGIYQTNEITIRSDVSQEHLSSNFRRVFEITLARNTSDGALSVHLDLT